MGRVVHTIYSECDIRVQRVSDTAVRIRITERGNSETATDFEIEGDPLCITDALSISASVLCRLDSFMKENPS